MLNTRWVGKDYKSTIFFLYYLLKNKRVLNKRTDFKFLKLEDTSHIHPSWSHKHGGDIFIFSFSKVLEDFPLRRIVSR